MSGEILYSIPREDSPEDKRFVLVKTGKGLAYLCCYDTNEPYCKHELPISEYAKHIVRPDKLDGSGPCPACDKQKVGLRSESGSGLTLKQGGYVPYPGVAFKCETCYFYHNESGKGGCRLYKSYVDAGGCCNTWCLNPKIGHGKGDMTLDYESGADIEDLIKKRVREINTGK